MALLSQYNQYKCNNSITWKAGDFGEWSSNLHLRVETNIKVLQQRNPVWVPALSLVCIIATGYW